MILNPCWYSKGSNIFDLTSIEWVRNKVCVGTFEMLWLFVEDLIPEVWIPCSCWTLLTNWIVCWPIDRTVDWRNRLLLRLDGLTGLPYRFGMNCWCLKPSDQSVSVLDVRNKDWPVLNQATVLTLLRLVITTNYFMLTTKSIANKILLFWSYKLLEIVLISILWIHYKYLGITL